MLGLWSLSEPCNQLCILLRRWRSLSFPIATFSKYPCSLFQTSLYCSFLETCVSPLPETPLPYEEASPVKGSKTLAPANVEWCLHKSMPTLHTCSSEIPLHLLASAYLCFPSDLEHVFLYGIQLLCHTATWKQPAPTTSPNSAPWLVMNETRCHPGFWFLPACSPALPVVAAGLLRVITHIFSPWGDVSVVAQWTNLENEIGWDAIAGGLLKSCYIRHFPFTH